MYPVLAVSLPFAMQSLREILFMFPAHWEQKMNLAYIEMMGSDPPARITVGGAELARGAAVEIDAVAYKP